MSELKTVTINDPSVKDIDKTVKNKFRWSWLQEKVKLDGNDLSFECFKKLTSPGHVLCTLCTDKINYASSGKKALQKHVSSPKHVKAWKFKRDNLTLTVSATEGVQATLPSNAENENRVVPLCDRVANNQVN